MNKVLSVSLSAEQLQELYRVILDRDGDGALAFLNDHLRKQVLRAMEGG